MVWVAGMGGNSKYLPDCQDRDGFCRKKATGLEKSRIELKNWKS